MPLTFSFLPETYGIYRLPEHAPIPTPMVSGFWAFSRAENEATVVCSVGGCPHAEHKNEGWKALKLHGPFDFSLTGILANVSAILAQAGISIFALSTYDTDYVLIKEKDVTAATHALVAAGHHHFV